MSPTPSQTDVVSLKELMDTRFDALTETVNRIERTLSDALLRIEKDHSGRLTAVEVKVDTHDDFINNLKGRMTAANWILGTAIAVLGLAVAILTFIVLIHA